MNISRIHPCVIRHKIKAPFFISRIRAGFPSPADDYLDKKLDLNEFLIQHPAATFFVRVEGDSMINAGIHSGDILIVDRALEARHNNVVVAVLNGEFTVKRLRREGERLLLCPANDAYKATAVTEDMDFYIWGVVIYVIHSV
ncbi:MAG: translesion error-prone DNA polymerase V autoproteolytic subunit [Methanosarcinaceae archaeon]|nr:translesion error-prone DNA polymerase V autoproteolytic subunit [Methanosarcinaceae archaeon]